MLSIAARLRTLGPVGGRPRHAPARAITRLPTAALRHVSSSAATTPHLLPQILEHLDNIAVIEPSRERAGTGGSDPELWTYRDLLRTALDLRTTIQDALPHGFRSSSPSSAPSAASPAQGRIRTRRRAPMVDIPRVAYLGARGPAYVAMQWGTWLAGALGVPLHPRHPAEELQYLVDDAGAEIVLVSDELLADHEHLRTWVLKLEHQGRCGVVRLPRPARPRDALVDDDGPLRQAIAQWAAATGDGATRGAHIVYTSGTTGRPKGVVTTHAGLTAQIRDVVGAWAMGPDDHLAHFLPLHHVHGILNNLLCVHYAGGSLAFLPAGAGPSAIWQALASEKSPPISMLMAVPTIYMNLLEDLERTRTAMPAYDVERALAGARGLRVAISGSMACPVSILERWERLTGHRLLERYGMTELGMVLTNPLEKKDGERHLGYVGRPFPSVRVRLVDPETETEIDITSEQEGELRVQGPTVFREYWGRPEATAKEFDGDGWFKTGDIAQYSNAHASFRIRGRASADIIKTGGYKVSALDIERVLLSHPQVHECAVFGIPDEKWGQIVGAVVRGSPASSPPPQTVSPEMFDPPLFAFLQDQLADYRVPRRFFFVAEIPKNAMGKVNKKTLASLFAV